MSNGTFITSRHVVFYEIVFPFIFSSSLVSQASGSVSSPSSSFSPSISLLLQYFRVPQLSDVDNGLITNTPTSSVSIDSTGLQGPPFTNDLNLSSAATTPTVASGDNVDDSGNSPSLASSDSSSASPVPTINNSVTNPSPVQNAHPMQTHGKSGISKKKIFVASVQHPNLEPTCFTKVSRLPVWSNGK